MLTGSGPPGSQTATSPFSLSTPNLLPRVKKLAPIQPFTFLTARLLEPSPNPEQDRSDLVAYISTSDSVARSALMSLPRQRSGGSVVEAFVRHGDRKYTFDSDGRMIRRHVLVRRLNLVGLGKEANRIEDAQVLGLKSVHGRAEVYAPWIERVVALPLSWGPRHGIDRANFARLKRKLRAGRVPK